ncbi:SAM-dependent methyltransferase [Sphingomonas jejuensis]|uniref:SAM-dependent methyltransferase n=1 Tax=Sphingomonas jejuensis TaxID=904715 RepID=A0ABX0XLG4_9SPHN|nr:class I SAM-dependent methyltransferase [Sphingomonas jejuensis]NJC33560.1 SAM-dependent methyltransferase [Sphingomonas jejuensis]
MADHPPEIFDRARRRLRRDRAAPRYAAHDVIHAHMTDEVIGRLDLVSRPFSDVLDLGGHGGALAARLAGRGMAVTSVDAGARFAEAAGGVQADEDRPIFAARSFDLILSVGVLDQLNDLPGALVLIRQMLRPDGLFLGSFIGGGSLPRLRAAMLAADGDQAAPRIHPQIDVRAAGDLLMRAGFTLPVVDGDRLTVRYRALAGLVADLRGMAATNLLRGSPPLGRSAASRAAAAFAAQADADGRVSETFNIVHLSGWAPSPDQPQPARRGSATASLADALRRAPPEGR